MYVHRKKSLYKEAKEPKVHMSPLETGTVHSTHCHLPVHYVVSIILEYKYCVQLESITAYLLSVPILTYCMHTSSDIAWPFYWTCTLT